MTRKTTSQPQETLDGVQLAILNKRIEGICGKMANTLFRTGRSGVLASGRDFSCCIVTADDELLNAAESLPVHVLSGADMMAKSVKEFHPAIKKGDAYLHNSPYHGNSHPADHTILAPVVDDHGIHRFTVVAKAHQADCGNSIPSTYVADAIDVYNEGALIFPAVKIQENYRDIEDIIRMCKLRIRVPEQWWGDYLAMLGAARIGEREMLALGEEIGWNNVVTFVREWLNYSEKRMIGAIGNLPVGSRTVTSTHDPFPDAPDGITVQATVTVDPVDAIISVDLRDNPDNFRNGLNLSEACARSAALLGVFNSVSHTVPSNAGSFRRVRIQLREGCVVGVPQHPTSCSAATTNLADRIGNATARAMAEIAEGHGMASTGYLIPPSIGSISGRDPRTENPFVNQVFLGWGGGAAAPKADAWLTAGHIGNSGLTHQDSVELDEARFPMIVKDRHYCADSGGAGRTKGGEGMIVEFGPLGCQMEIGYLSDGCINPAEGVRGGRAGAPASQYRRSVTGDIMALPAAGQVILEPGETIVSQSCGGGGYGSPHERSASKIVEDVREGWVSREAARSAYGVALLANGTVDQDTTDALRAQLRKG